MLLLEVNVLLVQFVFFLLESLLQFSVPVRQICSFILIFFLGLIGQLLFGGYLEFEGVYLVLEGNLGALQLGDLGG